MRTGSKGCPMESLLQKTMPKMCGFVCSEHFKWCGVPSVYFGLSSFTSSIYLVELGLTRKETNPIINQAIHTHCSKDCFWCLLSIPSLYINHDVKRFMHFMMYLEKGSEDTGTNCGWYYWLVVKKTIIYGITLPID